VSRYSSQATFQNVPIPHVSVYVYDQAYNSLSALFDDNALPLLNPLTTDAFGNYSFHAQDGLYDIRYVIGGKTIYQEDGVPVGPDWRTVVNQALVVGLAVSAAEAGILSALAGTTLTSATLGAGDRTILAALNHTLLLPAYLTESGREGMFAFSSANLAAKVTSDPNQGIYVAPASDVTGASGAWVRKYSGPASLSWFGPGTADDTAIIQSAFNVAQSVLFGAATYMVTGFVIPAGGQLITAGFATLIKQKPFTPAGTRMISMQSGSSIVGDISVEGQLGQAGDTTGEQNHGIFIYNDAAATSDLANVRIGNVHGQNIRGDIVSIGTHPTAYGAGYRVLNTTVGAVSGDNIYRIPLSIIGAFTVRVTSIECTRVGLYDFDIEPDAGSGPVVDVEVGRIKGSYIGLVNAGPATDFLDNIRIRQLDLDRNFSTASSPAYPGAHFYPDAVIFRNLKSARIDEINANNYNGQAVFQIYNGGELVPQRLRIGRAKLTNICLTDTTYHSFIEGGPGVTQLIIDEELKATTTLNTHVIVQDCDGAQINNPTFAGPASAWRGFKACPGARVNNIQQVNGYGALGCAGIRYTHGSFNGDTFFSFSDDSASYDVSVTASSAPNTGGNGVKLYGGSINGVRNTFTYYNGGATLHSIDGLGVATFYEAHATSKFQGALYDNSGNQVVSSRGAHIAHATGAAGGTPTGAEFNQNANALNSLLTFFEGWGALTP